MNTYDIVIDTNVLFSSLYSTRGASHKIFSLLEKDVFSFHLSVPLVLEYEEKLKENRKMLGLSMEEIEDIIDYLCLVGVRHYEIDVFWRPCLNDPDDEMVLELCVHSKSDFIVTHNIRDFRPAKSLRIRAITPNDFLRILREEKSI